MKVFFDTSAFAKRYLDEPGSQKVTQICRQAESLVLSVICLPEIISTLNRLVREKKLVIKNYRQIKMRVLDDLQDIEICYLTPAVIGQTIMCLEKNLLRAMDAMHLGCALAVKPDIFVSSDQQQIKAAKKMGLKVREI